MELNDITVFVDESGTIGKGKINRDDYFIVTLLLVRDEDVEHLKKVFKKERLFEIAVIVLNNKKATVKFRSNSSRVFNYLIKTFLNKHFKKNSKYKNVNQMHFVIDERNVATESKYTLQEYLNTELNLVETFSQEDIRVHYYDSKNYLLLQLADFISNTFYRYQQKMCKRRKEMLAYY